MPKVGKKHFAYTTKGKAAAKAYAKKKLKEAAVDKIKDYPQSKLILPKELGGDIDHARAIKKWKQQSKPVAEGSMGLGRLARVSKSLKRGPTFYPGKAGHPSARMRDVQAKLAHKKTKGLEKRAVGQQGGIPQQQGMPPTHPTKGPSRFDRARALGQRAVKGAYKGLKAGGRKVTTGAYRGLKQGIHGKLKQRRLRKAGAAVEKEIGSLQGQGGTSASYEDRMDTERMTHQQQKDAEDKRAADERHRDAMDHYIRSRGGKPEPKKKKGLEGEEKYKVRRQERGKEYAHREYRLGLIRRLGKYGVGTMQDVGRRGPTN